MPVFVHLTQPQMLGPAEPLEIDTTVPVAWVATVLRRIGLWDPGTTAPTDPGDLPITTYPDHWALDPGARDSVLEAVLRAGTIGAVSAATISLWGDTPADHELGSLGYPWESGNSRVLPGSWETPFATTFAGTGLGEIITCWASRNLDPANWDITDTSGTHGLSFAGLGFYLDGVLQAMDAETSSGFVLIGPSGLFNPFHRDARVWSRNAQWLLTGGDGDQVLAAWLQGSAYTGSSTLHLGLLDPTGAELSGGWYSRQAVTFAALVSHATSQNEDVSWTTGAGVMLDRLGVWSAASGGRLIQAWDPFSGGGARLVPAGTLITVFAGALHAHS